MRQLIVVLALLALASSAVANVEPLTVNTGDQPLYQWPVVNTVSPEDPGYIDFNRHELAIGDTVYVMDEDRPIAKDSNGYVYPHCFTSPTVRTTTAVVVDKMYDNYGPRYLFLDTAGLADGTAVAFGCRYEIPEQKLVFVP